MAVRCELVAPGLGRHDPGPAVAQYDAIIAAMSITDERRKKVDFTEKYAHIPNRLWRPGHRTDADAGRDGGQAHRLQRATTHDKYLTDNFGSSVTIVRYGSADEAYLDLKAGRVLALLADASAIEQAVWQGRGDKYDSCGPAPDRPSMVWRRHGDRGAQGDPGSRPG